MNMRNSSRCAIVMMFVPIMIICMTICSHAQFFLVCESGSVEELQNNIKAHGEHNYRLDEKFIKGYYRQKPLPSDLPYAELNDITKFLNKLKPRKAAVLFYAQSRGRLCTWLISASDVSCHNAQIDKKIWGSLRINLMHALNVSGTESKRAPVKRGVKQEEIVLPPLDAKKTFAEAGQYLLPQPIIDRMISRKIDTLIVVPVSSLGTIPFAALPVGDKMLVDLMSVVIAPGFVVFRDEPRISLHDFSNPVIVGDPEGWEDSKWNFPKLPGARAEADEVARLLNAKALIGRAAQKRRIEGMLNQQSRTGLIYLATHGVANMTDPRDKSFLLLSDGRWPAREIQNMPLRESRPLVVMSACQTGLGKDFDVGTIGMTRAWHRAGASSVVMSLWSVDDAATRDLMIEFVQMARSEPPDKALQKAMQTRRDKYPNPALWSGFTVFGLPELQRFMSSE